MKTFFVVCLLTLVKFSLLVADDENSSLELNFEGKGEKEQQQQKSENNVLFNYRKAITRRQFLLGSRYRSYLFRVSKEAEQLKGDVLVDYVNGKQDLWRAALNAKFATLSETVIQGMMGVKYVGHSVAAKKMLGKSRFLDIELPRRFDARENWPNCASIRAISDQSRCGSSWASGAVEAMRDRLCIATGGRVQVNLSTDDLLSCCRNCRSSGCKGGEPLEAWKFWMEKGIGTGSKNHTHQKHGCRPYPFTPCEHHSESCKKDFYSLPKWDKKKCQAEYTAQSGRRTYTRDKYYDRNAYAVDSNEQALKLELYTNGPIEVAFLVYEDFLNYRSGIYKHVAGKLLGGHAVKLVGWGEEDGVPYWVIANSWSTDFGEDGFFRIIRGDNECEIESGGVAGMPLLIPEHYHQQTAATESDDGTERRAANGSHDLGVQGITADCLYCVCNRESGGCKPKDCQMDRGSLSCGFFQIKKGYYSDCGKPGWDGKEDVEVAWKRCAADFDCSRTCVEAYLQRYAFECPGKDVCEQLARLHNGGPAGCEKHATDDYWKAIKSCLDTPKRICPSGKDACHQDQICCQTSDTFYHCCKHKDGTCCLDGPEYCCPVDTPKCCQGLFSTFCCSLTARCGAMGCFGDYNTKNGGQWARFIQMVQGE